MSPVPPATSPSKGKVFLSRLVSTVFLWATLTVALWLDLDWLLLGMMAVVGVLGTWEYVRLQREDEGAGAYSKLVVILSAGYWAALLGWYAFTENVGAALWWLDAALLVIGGQAVFFMAFRQGLEGEKTLRRVFNGFFAMVYTIFLWGFMAKLLLAGEAANGSMLVLTVILVTKFGDMGAYLFGSWLGKHKMVPHISPAKTWEGFGGAVFSSCLGMAIMLLVLEPGTLEPFGNFEAMALAPFIAVLGVMGDLAESVLKRCHHIKDSGHKLPGIGGILDLTDSLLFTVPVVYLFIILFA
ncbi:phosphatidate cytidylyltransferase [Phragmitibacter flavus]|nr:phosphatidate cytidylyltransferase [Phragmitibacter flavus]